MKIIYITHANNGMDAVSKAFKKEGKKGTYIAQEIPTSLHETLKCKAWTVLYFSIEETANGNMTTYN
jgi:hypothetical protein